VLLGIIDDSPRLNILLFDIFFDHILILYSYTQREEHILEDEAVDKYFSQSMSRKK